MLLAGAAGATASAPSAASGQADTFTQFQSPSGNIGCAIGRQGGVRCDIRNRDWRPPPKPASCMLDWGFGLTLERRGRARFVCAGDTVLGQGRRLAYGEVDPPRPLPLREPAKRDALHEPPQRPRLRAVAPAGAARF